MERDVEEEVDTEEEVVDEQDPTTFLSVIDQEDDRDTKNHTLLLINTFCFCDIYS